MDIELKNSEKNMTYKKAFLYSIVVDAVFFVILGYSLANIFPPFIEKEMKISLAVDMSQNVNSGGSGGNEGGYAPLEEQSPLEEKPTEKTVQDISPQENLVDKYTEANTATTKSKQVSSPNTSASSNTIGRDGGRGFGEGTGTGSGTGDRTGSGMGTGTGTGDGSGTGTGTGIGSGTEPGYVDISLYLNRLDENKVYPPMAVKRGLTGTAVFHVTFSSTGDIIAVELIESSGESILDKAAEKLIYEGGQIINTTGEETTQTIPIHYHLND